MQKRSCFEIPAKMVEKLFKFFVLLAIFCSLFICTNSEKTYMTEDEYEAENEEFVFYDDDKRCGARGRIVVTLQPPGDSGGDTIGCQPLQMLMLILARARLLPTLSFIKISAGTY